MQDRFRTGNTGRGGGFKFFCEVVGELRRVTWPSMNETLRLTLMVLAVSVVIGVVLGAAYMLWLYRRVVFGRIVNSDLKNMKDLNKTELYIFSSLVILVIFFGIYPDPLFKTVDISINNLIENYQINLDFHLVQKGS